VLVRDVGPGTHDRSDLYFRHAKTAKKFNSGLAHFARLWQYPALDEKAGSFLLKNIRGSFSVILSKN
jgi:hypothetical protein